MEGTKFDTSHQKQPFADIFQNRCYIKFSNIRPAYWLKRDSGVFPAIFPVSSSISWIHARPFHFLWTLCANWITTLCKKCPYSNLFSPFTGKCGPDWLRIWTVLLILLQLNYFFLLSFFLRFLLNDFFISPFITYVGAPQVPQFLFFLFSSAFFFNNKLLANIF